MGVTEYLNAFDRLNNKLKAHDMKLPEGVLAYRVLKSANLTEEQEQLAKATVDAITYKAMCDKLRSIFGDSKNKTTTQSKPAIELNQDPFYCNNEEEEVYYTSTSGYGQRGNTGRGRTTFRSRGGGRQMGQSFSRGRFDDQRSRQNNRNDDQNSRFDNFRRNSQKQNPIDNRGQVSRCTVCDSTRHWMKECPHRTSFTMFTSSDIQECYISKLVGESFAGGLLDCGCTKTVCGSDWYRDFVSNLSEDDKKEVKN